MLSIAVEIQSYTKIFVRVERNRVLKCRAVRGLPVYYFEFILNAFVCFFNLI